MAIYEYRVSIKSTDGSVTVSEWTDIPTRQTREDAETYAVDQVVNGVRAIVAALPDGSVCVVNARYIVYTNVEVRAKS